MKIVGVVSVAAALAVFLGAGANDDLQLRAMVDELARSKTLHLNDLDKPYFVSYSVSDTDQVTISGSLGGLTASNSLRLRRPVVQVRVGNYDFDNSNSVYARPRRSGLMPIDDDYQAVRARLWLTTDGLYKAAADEIARKRAALRELSEPDKTPDFATAPAVQVLQPPVHLAVDRAAWEARIRNLSAAFLRYPAITSSRVNLFAVGSTYRLANTEGTLVRVPQELAQVDIRVQGLAADGSRVWDHRAFCVTQPAQLPSEGVLSHAAEEMGARLEALEKAPVLNDYSGPVLFEQEAAAQLIAQIMADAVHLQRRPVSPPGANVPATLESVWASRLGTKVAPDWIGIVDDPTQATMAGQILTGAYTVDDEGVAAQRVVLVDGGTLKAFLVSREPVRTFHASNGHGRLPGNFGSEAAVIGNLFVQASQTVPESAMRAKLLERVHQAGLPFGIVIRRLDFPSTAELEDLQSIAREMQKNGFARTVAAPLIALRVYPDGHEELVRGARFREFSAKNLRDLALASDKPYVFNYVNNGSSFDYSVGSDATTSAVVAPSLLFEGVELTHAEGESHKAPLVPAPALVGKP